MAHLDRRALRIGRPRERALLEAFVQDPKSGVIPDQDLQSIPAPIAKEKEMPRERIQIEALAHQRGQAINRAPQIGGPGGHVDPNRRRNRQHDARNADTTARTRSVEISARMITRSPLASSTSIVPPPTVSSAASTRTAAKAGGLSAAGR